MELKKSYIMKCFSFAFLSSLLFSSCLFAEETFPLFQEEINPKTLYKDLLGACDAFSEVIDRGLSSWSLPDDASRFSFPGTFLVILDTPGGVIYQSILEQDEFSSVRTQVQIIPFLIDPKHSSLNYLPIPSLFIFRVDQKKGIYGGTSLANSLSGGSFFGTTLLWLHEQGLLSKIILNSFERQEVDSFLVEEEVKTE